LTNIVPDGWMMGGAHLFTLKHLNRQTGLKSIAIGGTQFGWSRALCRQQRSQIIASIVPQPNSVPPLKQMVIPINGF
jgi:hypothetical protein